MSHGSSSSSSFVTRSPAVAALERAVRSRVRAQRRDVEPAFVVDAAGDVGDRDHARAAVVQLRAPRSRRRCRSPGRRSAGSASCQPSRSQARSIDHHDAGARRLVAEERAAERDRLAGDDLRHRVADLHRVRVHHPGHRLLVRGHVRSGDVLLRADDRQELRGEAARERLQLVRRERRAGCSGRRPSRRRRAAAAARTSRSSTSRAPRIRRASTSGS